MIKTETAPAETKTATMPIQKSSQEGIALRAYQIFLERGCEHGHDVDDWLQAEREIRSGGVARKPRPVS